VCRGSKKEEIFANQSQAGASFFSVRDKSIAGKGFKKQVFIGSEIMFLPRPSFTRSTLTERIGGDRESIVSRDAIARPSLPLRR
jgi:hypothetical protein